MAILAYGVNYRTAPVEFREKIAFPEETLGDALQAATRAIPSVSEAAIISTCNRTELYLAMDPNQEHGVVEWLADARAITAHRAGSRCLQPLGPGCGQASDPGCFRARLPGARRTADHGPGENGLRSGQNRRDHRPRAVVALTGHSVYGEKGFAPIPTSAATRFPWRMLPSAWRSRSSPI